MDLTADLINELGGGVMAVALVVMGAVIIALWRRGNAQQDARFADLKEHSKELRVIADGSAAAINGLTRVLEDRRNA